MSWNDLTPQHLGARYDAHQRQKAELEAELSSLEGARALQVRAQITFHTRALAWLKGMIEGRQKPVKPRRALLTAIARADLAQSRYKVPHTPQWKRAKQKEKAKKAARASDFPPVLGETSTDNPQ